MSGLGEWRRLGAGSSVLVSHMHFSLSFPVVVFMSCVCFQSIVQLVFGRQSCLARWFAGLKMHSW